MKAARIVRFVGIAGGVLVALLVAAVGGLWAWGESRHAAAAPEALAALASDALVEVRNDRWLVFRPLRSEPAMGLVFYPGAHCDVRGYAPLLRRIAAAGYLVVAVPMPLGLAVLAPDRALRVQAAFPGIGRWALAGHSLGGAMAAAFVHDHPDAADVLVIWDAYPPDGQSLERWHGPVWLIHRATPDGRPPAAFAARRALFPRDSRWVAVPGGIHMYFGAFLGGGFVEDWPASTPRAAQQDLVVAATLEALGAAVR